MAFCVCVVRVGKSGRTAAAKRMANKVTDAAFLWFCVSFAQRKQKQLQ